ncbi:helix-hairpin-helix domain-containing protein [Chitinophaga sp. G-6-1-13]|uniref:Helix-hairpin-helix domain-containing protein n=1 Tax=Chitinophaga fulva TaxID=2728842 RepID=A0A848GZI2_9BACT|nr:helix-hairpin-helix domain-containing protein [Chitinophaga fulva]NML41018.1 helix-hairpin-helix domain-containing protein [Chitinophaga fulva]
MSLKRLWGVLLGIVTGVIPFIDTLTATFFAYRLQKKKWVLVHAINAGVMLVAIIATNMVAKQDKPIKKAFPPAFQENLQTVIVRRSTPVDSVEMETILRQVLKNTADQLIQQDKKHELKLQNARNGSLSEKPQAAFHKISQYCYEDYLNKTKGGTGQGRYDVTFDGNKLMGDRQLAGDVDSFVGLYLEAEGGAVSGLIGGVLLICYFIGMVGSIANGANLFINPAEATVTNTARTTANEDSVRRSFDRQPQEQRRDEPAPQPLPQRTPPPLPQETAAPVMVNVNIAEEEELMQLRGINRILAKTIVSERKNGGDFMDLNDLKKRLELSFEQAERIKGNVDFDAPKRGGGRVIEF